jgi:hypothetical protein
VLLYDDILWVQRQDNPQSDKTWTRKTLDKTNPRQDKPWAQQALDLTNPECIRIYIHCEATKEELCSRK